MSFSEALDILEERLKVEETRNLAQKVNKSLMYDINGLVIVSNNLDSNKKHHKFGQTSWVLNRYYFVVNKCEKREYFI